MIFGYPFAYGKLGLEWRSPREAASSEKKKTSTVEGGRRRRNHGGCVIVCPSASVVPRPFLISNSGDPFLLTALSSLVGEII